MLDILYAFLIAFSGLLVHWAKRRKRKQTEDSFFVHMFENISYTLKSIGGLSVSIMFLSKAGFDFSDPHLIGELFSIGFINDSLFNRNKT